jgi:hypothetical protein
MNFSQARVAWENEQLNRYQSEIDEEARMEYAIEKMFESDEELLLAIRNASWGDTIQQALEAQYDRYRESVEDNYV